MSRKKSHGQEVRPTIPLQWTKDDPDGKERFERACARYGAASVTVARALCDEWAKLVLAKDETEFEASVKAVAKKTAKKK